MRIVAMLGVLACSCGPSSAIEVVVEMPDGDPNLVVDEVRLYVGLGDPLNERKDGNGQLLEDVIIPRGYTPSDPIPKGYFWKRDVPSSPDQDRAPLDGNEVRFTFQPGSHDRITVIAVGYQGGKRPPRPRSRTRTWKRAPCASTTSCSRPRRRRFRRTRPVR